MATRRQREDGMRMVREGEQKVREAPELRPAVDSVKADFETQREVLVRSGGVAKAASGVLEIATDRLRGELLDSAGPKGISTKEVVEALTKRYRGEEEGVFDWFALGADVGGLWRSAAPVRFVFGPIAQAGAAEGGEGGESKVVPRKRAPRVVEKDEGGTPKVVVAEEKVMPEVEVATARRIRQLHEDLQRLMKTHARKARLLAASGEVVETERLDLYATLFDPNSFTRTVDNIFHFSFLVKQGHAAIDVDEAGNPVIGVDLAAAPRAPGADGRGATAETILNLDPGRWRTIVDVLGIRESPLARKKRERES